MRKLVLTILVLMALPLIFWGCAEKVTSYDGGYSYNFSVGDIQYHIEIEGGSSSAHNPTSYRYWINIKECDSRCEDRAGLSFSLGENYTASWRGNYPAHCKLKITQRFDGVTSVNEIRLGKISAQDILGIEGDVDVYIDPNDGIKYKTGDIDGDINTGNDTDDPAQADYVEVTLEVTLW